MKKKIILSFIFSLICVNLLFSQSVKRPKMIIGIKGNNVYVYQTKLLPVGEGFNIYRKDAGEVKFKKLNDSPVIGARYPSQLLNYLGNKYSLISKELNTSNPIGLYLKLRTNDFAADLYTFFYPGVAKALGRLYIDSTAKINSSVTYKIEFTNSSGTPVGKPVSKKVTLKRVDIPVPLNLSASNKGNYITLRWNYPLPSKTTPDNVARFNVYEFKTERKTAHLLNRIIILRDARKKDFSFEYTTNKNRGTIRFFVTALNIMGEESVPGKVVTYNIKDNVAPSPVLNIKASYKKKKAIITWNLSPEPDVKGYNVYRTLNTKTDYKKINKRLINVLSPVYTDSLINGGSVYKYKITAVDSSGNVSKKSIYAYVRIPYTEKPATPTDFTAVLNKNNTVSLKWNYYGSKNSLKSFIVLKRAVMEKGIPFSRINKLYFLSKTLIDSGVAGSGFKEGWTYIYALFAQGKSDFLSDTLFAKVIVPDSTPPHLPKYFYANNKDGFRVHLSWSHSISRDIGFYVIKKRQINNNSFTVLKKFNWHVTSYNDDDVKVATKYIYTITAIDTTGNVSKQSKPDTVFVRDFDPPSQVRNVRIRILNNKVILSWEPANDADLAGYKVYYSNSSTGVYKPLEKKIIMKTNITFDNENSKLWYVVKAVDSSGNESRKSVPVHPAVVKSENK